MEGRTIRIRQKPLVMVKIVEITWDDSEQPENNARFSFDEFQFSNLRVTSQVELNGTKFEIVKALAELAQEQGTKTLLSAAEKIGADRFIDAAGNVIDGA